MAAWRAEPDRVDAATLAQAVRFTLEELTARHPGGAVEVRVPPYGAAQCIGGLTHTRGTPPNVVETDPATWLGLVTGRVEWQAAVGEGRLHATGSRADLSGVLPLSGLRPEGPGVHRRCR